MEIVKKDGTDIQYFCFDIVRPGSFPDKILIPIEDFRAAVAHCLGATVIGDGMTNPFRGKVPPREPEINSVK